MIQDLFKTTERTSKQENFLKVLSRITTIKKANGDIVDEYDKAVEEEARTIVKEN
ncbi:MAG: hypothetical protein GY941_22525 [Planctomycetes bacterium]|nr:hypothetical protein [Planctomycetota bacterium]